MTRRKGHLRTVVFLAVLATLAVIPSGAQEGGTATVPATDEPVLTSRFTADFEYRYRSSDLSVETTAAKNAIDFSRDFLERPPMMGLYLDYGAAEGLGVAVGIAMQRQWSLEQHFTSTNLFPMGIENNPVAMENSCVNLGTLSWKSPGLQLVLGRQVVDYSDGLAGALLPSPRLPYLDAFKLHADIGRLGVDWLVSSIRAVQAVDKVDVDPNDLNGDGLYDGDDADAGGSYYYGFEDGSAWVGDGIRQGNPTAIFEVLHRFTWAFDDFSLGITGHVMYARRNNRYSILDFLPVISFHQAILTQVNMSALLDARWDPLPGLWFAAQAGFDDINANLVGINDNDASTIGAAVIGGGWSTEGASGAWEIEAEAGYTHFLWGNYNGTQNPPYDLNPFLRFIYRYRVDGGTVLMPLTSPYGPGALWFRGSGSWKPAGTDLSAGLELLVLSKNSAANLIDTKYYTDLDTTAAADRILFISLSAPLRWRWHALEVYTTPEFVIRDGEAGFLVSAGVGLRLGS